MSGKEFFVERYERLGWKFADVKPRQAIRLNVTNIEGKSLEERLEVVGGCGVRMVEKEKNKGPAL